MMHVDIVHMVYLRMFTYRWAEEEYYLDLCEPKTEFPPPKDTALFQYQCHTLCKQPPLVI